jgi:hypothetical protein
MSNTAVQKLRFLWREATRAERPGGCGRLTAAEVRMARNTQIPTILKGAAGALGLAGAAYATYVGVTWLRYGQPAPPDADNADPLLDQFMPIYDVAERHQTRVAAPPDVTFAAACEQDLTALPLVRAIFKTRELVLGARPDTTSRPRGLLALTKSLGWGVLAEVPHQEVVMGAVTQPWFPNVVFSPLPPDEFARFHEPDFVKIIWNLRVEPAGPRDSIFRTETRVVTTDAEARAKFRWYWAKFSAGITLIRWLSLGPVRRDAERRATAGSPSVPRLAADSDGQTRRPGTRDAYAPRL